MASIQEKLADSQSVLKQYQDTHENGIIHGFEVLGATHTKRLIQNGYLEQVIKGWYDGNGRTARFLMNLMLVTGNYPWRIVTVEERAAYMAALEKASIEGDITDFAKVIMNLD